MRLLKTPLLLFAALMLVGVLVFGANFSSYVRTSARSVQEAVKDAVPIEFELRRARDLIDAILPQLQAQVRMIAEEEVEIANLELDIAKSLARVESERASIVAMRAKADTALVSVTVGKRELSRSQLVDQLHGRFERFKQSELALQSKQRLLQRRQESLSAALNMLAKTRDRKAELEQKVETLAANHRLVKASKIEAGRLMDGSGLASADQLLTQIQTRLDVAQRVLAYEQDLESFADESATLDDWIDEDQLLSTIDEHLGREEAKMSSSRLAQSENEPL